MRRTEQASALVGDTATLKCRIDVAACGEMHSVKWYKDDERIYVFSASKSSAINRPEGAMMERVSEHIRSMRKQDDKGSAVAEHSMNSDSTHYIRFDKFRRVVARAERRRAVRVLQQPLSRVAPKTKGYGLARNMSS
ncbi:hypothetical protein MSG28_015695 [Choristoneura fumiferana]|uniref:Uncharacterized protein n=1 Tax=Choristoneura fumiferana TaxID=7141 RepID=A0ACC0KBX1_CHOFU|nr:hypothetical protein MSG28_015695 [Choristoneura fumiferana]